MKNHQALARYPPSKRTRHSNRANNTNSKSSLHNIVHSTNSTSVYYEADDNNTNETTDEGEIIRCICKSQAVFGLMIQCEICKVWQHCSCVDIIDEKDCPDHYFCELCFKNKKDKISKETNKQSELDILKLTTRKKTKLKKSLSSASSSSSNNTSQTKETKLKRDKKYIPLSHINGSVNNNIELDVSRLKTRKQNPNNNKATTHIKLVSKSLDLETPNQKRNNTNLNTNINNTTSLKVNETKPINQNKAEQENNQNQPNSLTTIKLVNTNNTQILTQEEVDSFISEVFPESSIVDPIDLYLEDSIDEPIDIEIQRVLRLEYRNNSLRRPKEEIHKIVNRIINNTINKKNINTSNNNSNSKEQNNIIKPKAITPRININQISKRISYMEAYINNLLNKKNHVKEPLNSLSRKLAQDVEMFKQKYLM